MKSVINRHLIIFFFIASIHNEVKKIVTLFLNYVSSVFFHYHDIKNKYVRKLHLDSFIKVFVSTVTTINQFFFLFSDY